MDFIDTLRKVLGKVQGCPELEAVDAMRDTIVEFCKETRCWTSDVTVATTGTVGAIDLELQVLDVIDAWIGSAPVDVLAQNDPQLQDLGTNRYVITFEDPSVLTLHPTPPAAVQLRLFRAFAPGPEATEFPDVIWLRHSQALVDGCLARLFAAPAQAWANPALSTFHRDRFDAAMTEAAADYGINRKQTGRRLRVHPV